MENELMNNKFQWTLANGETLTFINEGTRMYAPYDEICIDWKEEGLIEIVFLQKGKRVKSEQVHTPFQPKNTLTLSALDGRIEIFTTLV
jgi:hypothetical protein